LCVLATRRSFKRGQDAVSHLGGGGLGKSDGNDLTRLIHFRQKAQKSAGEQIRLAGTGGCLHED
jgi:hypothetical protein